MEDAESEHALLGSADTELEANDNPTFEALLRAAAIVSGNVERTPAPLATGTSIGFGRFSIVRSVGEGGMGRVYEALDHESGTRVALKTLNRLDAAGVYQLKNEFRTLADVTHPNLVRLHELFADGERWFFTMDLIDGVPFDRWVRPNGALDAARLRAALAQLSAGVHAIHTASKLHRDLKPSNVLVTSEGHVFVLDFGLAIDPLPGSAGQTLDRHAIVGTPAYMAPEQAAGESLQPASDLYAIGVMLFEALTGRLPFEGHAHEILVDKQRLAAPAPGTLAADLDADLVALCERLLARDPAARPLLLELRQTFEAPEASTDRAFRAPEPSLLLGRAAPLAALHDAYAAAISGRKPVVVLVSGEGGIGKSALAAVFLDELRQRGGAFLLSGRCYERESVPYKAFDAVVDELSRELRRLATDRTAVLLPRDTFALRQLFPVLGRVDAIAEAPERDVLDAHELRERAFLAFAELLGRIRDRQPLVLHLDDVQWSDADSTTLLMHLLRQPDAPRLLLLASHRNEAADTHPCLAPLYSELPIDSRLDVRRIALGPLPEVEARGLLAALGYEPEPALLREAAGNPFLLGELARHAAESAARGEGLGSLRELLLARVRALPDEARRLLEVLAVAAQPTALTIAASAAATTQLPRTLFALLCEQRLARATGHEKLSECFHDRIREFVLDALTPAELQEHHRALAAALATSPAPDPERLAGHLLATGDRIAAAEHLALAAARASRELGFERAARLYALALEHGRFAHEATLRLRAEHATALSEAGSGIAAAEAYLEAMPVGDATRETELQLRAAEHFFYSGRLDRGLEHLAAALRMLGIRLPKSTAEVGASVAYHQARLYLRRHRWSGTRDITPTAAQQIDALRRASDSLLRLDTLRAIELGTRCALLELSHGTQSDAAIALSRLMFTTTLTTRSAAAVSAAMERAGALARDSHDPVVRLYYDVFLACTVGVGVAHDVHRHIEHLTQALERLQSSELREALARSPWLGRALPSLSQNRGIVAWMLALARVTAGDFRVVALELPAQLDEAWSRSDLCMVPLWQHVSALAALAQAEDTVVEYRLEKAVAAWSSSQMTYQEMNLCSASHLLANYRQQARRAWEFAERSQQRMLQSPMRYSVYMDVVKAERFQCGAALVSELPRGSERDALVSHLIRSDKRIALRDLQHVALATIACCQRDDARAIAELRAAVAVTPGWRTHHYAWKRRLGVLVGGDEGRALVAEADAFFIAGGCVDVEPYVRAIAPGLTVE